MKLKKIHTLDRKERIQSTLLYRTFPSLVCMRLLPSNKYPAPTRDVRRMTCSPDIKLQPCRIRKRTQAPPSVNTFARTARPRRGCERPRGPRIWRSVRAEAGLPSMCVLVGYTHVRSKRSYDIYLVSLYVYVCMWALLTPFDAKGKTARSRIHIYIHTYIHTYIHVLYVYMYISTRFRPTPTHAWLPSPRNMRAELQLGRLTRYIHTSRIDVVHARWSYRCIHTYFVYGVLLECI